MRDLGFKDRWAGSVVDGSKPFTLRRPWKRPGDMPDVGDIVGIVTGWRTPARKRIATARVAFRCEVQFRPEEIEGVALFRTAVMHPPVAERVRDLLLAAAAGDAEAGAAFAALDGFASYADFWTFHDAHRKRTAASVTMTRELIGFDRVTAEFAS